jgi:hypothetical protein
MTALGPLLPTWILRHVGSYLRYTERGTNAVEKGNRDPIRNKLGTSVSAIHSPATRPPSARCF